MAYGCNFALILDDTLVLVGEEFDNELHGLLVGGEGLLADDFFFFVRIGSNLVGKATHLKADALGYAGAEHSLGFHLDELVFAGRRAGIDNKNFHKCP